MPLKIYNTLTRKKETFRPLHKEWAGLYTCGPTVYNFAHIGNLRTFIFEDILRRTLEYAGFRVRHIMNTTDVDDKTIRASKEAGEDLASLTRRYEKAFREDLKILEIKPPTKLARATEHIAEMIRLIEILMKKGHAYTKGGSVYFNISSFPSYGKLARLDRKALKVRARVDMDEYTKNEVHDFALWKGRRGEEPSWEAPFGEGRPGWHIECSAMSMAYLGSTFDIHAAGVDLIFPHHENEIAQSEAATKKQFVRYWVHGEHLLVEDKKMSKSLGNIFTLRDIEAKNISPLSYRYLTLTAHYRSKLNFTWDSLRAAENSLERIYDFLRELKETTPAKHNSAGIKNQNKIKKYRMHFAEAIFNDLDMPAALAVLWQAIHDYRREPERFSPKEVRDLFYEFDQVLGLRFKEIKIEKTQEKILQLLRMRDAYRDEKRFEKADLIRKKIESLGWSVKDTPEGSKVKKEV